MRAQMRRTATPLLRWMKVEGKGRAPRSVTLGYPGPPGPVPGPLPHPLPTPPFAAPPALTDFAVLAELLVHGEDVDGGLEDGLKLVVEDDVALVLGVLGRRHSGVGVAEGVRDGCVVQVNVALVHWVNRGSTVAVVVMVMHREAACWEPALHNEHRTHCGHTEEAYHHLQVVLLDVGPDELDHLGPGHGLLAHQGLELRRQHRPQV